MTLDQAASFTIIGAVMALLVWDRLRYDVVAAAGLMAGIAVGVIPAKEAFKGFGDDIVIIVGSALIVSAAVEKAGVVDRLVRPLLSGARSTSAQIVLLASAVAVLSAFMKNIGALAIFLPVAFQLAHKTGTPPSRLLMPLSFAALLGGIATLIGTSPNVIVSRVRASIVGEPFAMFDFLPVGGVLALLGVSFLAVGWRLLPEHRTPGGQDSFAITDYTAEARLRPGSPFVGRTVAEFEEAADGDVTVIAIIRERTRRYTPSGNWVLYEDDLLVLECDAAVLKRLAVLAKLELEEGVPVERRDQAAVIEAVVMERSPMIGSSAVELGLRERYGVTLMALSRRGEPVRVRLRRARFQKGDLLVLHGGEQGLPQTMSVLGLLPLAERRIDLAPPKRAWLTIAILAVAMTVAAFEITTVAVAFFGAAVAMVLTKALPLKDAYARIDWPILVLLGAMIPISETLSRTGASDLIAGGLSGLAVGLSPVLSLGMVLVAAMAVTPFLNNAATVLVMAPIAVGLANRLGQAPDAFLMAVAIGAACDFLTPIGHQCNTLVMGPGGYRFGDYWRLGLPLSLLVVTVGTPLVYVFWG